MELDTALAFLHTAVLALDPAEGKLTCTANREQEIAIITGNTLERIATLQGVEVEGSGPQHRRNSQTKCNGELYLRLNQAKAELTVTTLGALLTRHVLGIVSRAQRTLTYSSVMDRPCAGVALEKPWK